MQPCRNIKILTSAEMGAADRATFARVAVDSRAIMENAGRQVTEVLLSRYAAELGRGVVVFAGKGNNGGDGYVVARSLHVLDIDVAVVATAPIDQLTGDCKANADSFAAAGGTVIELSEDEWDTTCRTLELERRGLFVDALYGTGLRGPVRGYIADLISAVNCMTVPVVAIDIPSGVEADTGLVHNAAIRAEATVALQALKCGHVQFPGTEWAGDIYLADIGVSNTLPEIGSIPRELITEGVVAGILRERLPAGAATHKGIRGHLAVIGGGAGHFGAPKLSGYGALRSGAGLVTLALPQRAAEVLAPTLKELMCAALAGDKHQNFADVPGSAVADLLSGKRACAVGPGMGTGAGSAELLENVLKHCKELKLPAVIDADALNIISSHSELKNLLGPWAVLTPHPGEMSRLMNCSAAEVQSRRLEVAADCADQLGCWLVLKGARTVISAPTGAVFVNPAASSALATAGSGDVLTGVIGAFLANGFPMEQAVVAGVYVHGLAGEHAAAKLGGVCGVIAGDIADSLPPVINSLYAAPAKPAASCRLVLPRISALVSNFSS